MTAPVSLTALLDLLHDHASAWEGEEDSVREEHAELIDRTRGLLAAAAVPFHELPPVEWAARFDAMPHQEAVNAERTAATVAQMAARAAAYLSVRTFHGGTHVEAVKRQNAVVRGVRKALGFAYPDDPHTF